MSRSSAADIDRGNPTQPGRMVLLGLGANIGEPLAQLREAVALLENAVRVEIVSDVYLTEPVGVRSQPDFYNLVLQGRTELTVTDLLRQTQRIEKDLGRTEGVRYGPRSIDIDILAYDDLVMTSAALVVPHPRMHVRSFVLTPLAQICPGWRHPVLGLRAAELLDGLRTSSAVKRLDTLVSASAFHR